MIILIQYKCCLFADLTEFYMEVANGVCSIYIGAKGLATLIASVKLQKSCQVGVLPDTRKCYNSDQITCANGY